MYPASGAEPIDELPQRQNFDSFPGAERKHLAIASDNEVRTRGERALEDAIVGLVGKHLDTPRWRHELSQRRQEERGPRNLVGIARELACKNPQNLREDRPGERELESPLHSRIQGLLRNAAGNGERGDEYVRVEDDFHLRSRRSRSRSVR